MLLNEKSGLKCVELFEGDGGHNGISLTDAYKKSSLDGTKKGPS
jgi:hypothetical protein